MILNRPKYLENKIKFYPEFPSGKNLDVDYHCLPPLLNFDFHTLNGILPLTDSRFAFIGKNGLVDGKESTVVFVNPLPEEYEYYKNIGVTEFQAIQILINFYAFEEREDGSLVGLPYSVSLVPMEENKKIDPWNIEFLKNFDLEKLRQKSAYVYTEFDPFNGWSGGLVMHYTLLSKTGHKGYSDSMGFHCGMYFLSPVFDKKEVILSENKTFSNQINAKYRKFKTQLYFNSFENVNPRRIWGCGSPIELFLVQGLYVRNLKPDIQTCFFRNGTITTNYYKMQEDEIWIGEHDMITSADLFFPKEKLAIFCDGVAFHDEEKDKKINASLNELGIKTLRYTGKQITEELENVLDDIERHLKLD
jgi:hypothetical protein